MKPNRRPASIARRKANTRSYAAERRRIGKVALTCRGPGGPMEKEDRSWVRACRSDGWSLLLIASHFDPRPTMAALRRMLGERRRK